MQFKQTIIWDIDDSLLPGNDAELYDVVWPLVTREFKMPRTKKVSVEYWDIENV